MHEVISFSASQSAGHLLTHLYNVQELHIPYSKDTVLSHSNDVFLWPLRVNGRANYYPRTLNFEFDGGYGFLGKYDFHEPKLDISTLGSDVSVTRKERVEKNKYQQILDSGGQTNSSLLNKANTTYWSDYNKLVYRPTSLLEVENYVHPLGHHKHFQKLLFKDYNVGEEEFAPLFDQIEDTFRKNLEALDMIQGVNFISEVDSAWGGFTNEMLVQLKDEYFNNGANSKHNIWTYGLVAQEPNVLTRIKSFVEFSKNSSLFIPLCLDNQSSTLLSEDFDFSCLWHRGAVQAAFVNLIWGLNSQMELPVRMAEIEAGIVMGFDKRNIVNEIRIEEQEEKAKGGDFGLASDVNIMDAYMGLSAAEPKGQSFISLGISGQEKRIGKKTVISKLRTESDDIQYVNAYIDEITKVDSTPPVMEKSFQTTFGQNVGLKDLMKEYRKVIQRVRLPQHLKVIGDKAELVEDLSVLIEEYTLDYEDESDFE